MLKTSFANPKPVSQNVSAFGGGQLSALKVPVPATPGFVFGQTSTIGTAANPVSVFGQQAFGSSPTPTTAACTTSSAFIVFSGTSASSFGKAVKSGRSFSDML